MEKKMSEKDYSLLDSPGVLQYLFHPRPENPILYGMSPERDIFIPVEKDIMIGAAFYMEKKENPNILFFHGNGEIVADYQDLGPLYNQLELNFLAADYRGYGRSDGSPTVSSMMRDCRSIFEFTCRWLRENAYSGPVIVMGRSLGSASALELASQYADQVDGLIIESGFAHTLPLLRLLGAQTEGLEEKSAFCNRDKIGNYQGPVLIIHGENDHIIPFSDGQALYDACISDNKTLLTIPRADHNNLLHTGFREYMAAVKTLADNCRNM